MLKYVKCDLTTRARLTKQSKLVCGVEKETKHRVQKAFVAKSY